MKSEKHPTPGSDDVSQANESVPVAAARVFSNYVFVPAAGQPDEGKPAPGLHGAALLVFADESAEQVKLRTGYAAHVAGDAALRPREDALNEIVSSHDSPAPNSADQVRKENTMIACSVCRTVIQPGSTSCPGCGLALVAQAVPVIKRTAPIWPYVLGAVILFVILANVADRWQRGQLAETRANLVSDLKSNAMGTPAAFQTRCGAARWTAQAKDGIELHYLAGGNDYYVTFAAAGPRFESGRVMESNSKMTAYRVALDPNQAMQILGCK